MKLTVVTKINIRYFEPSYGVRTGRAYPRFLYACLYIRDWYNIDNS